MTQPSGPAGAGGWLHVDLEVLQDLHSRLRSLTSDLAHLAPSSSVSTVDAGDRAVQQAVDRFLDGWRDGRARIEENVAAVVRVVELAVEEYGATERKLHDVATATGDGGAR